MGAAAVGAVDAMARALSPTKPAAAAHQEKRPKGARGPYICTPCAMVKKELVLLKKHTCTVSDSDAGAAMAAARKRMPAVQGGHAFKIKDYLALPGVRRDTHWVPELKENPLLKLHLKWNKYICEKCAQS